LVGRLVRKVTQQVFAQDFKALGAAKDLKTSLESGVTIRNRHHHEANTHLIVFFKDAIGVGHHNATPRIVVLHGDLGNFRPSGTCGVVGGEQQVELSLLANGRRKNRHGGWKGSTRS
jgi:hypothetical protein